MRKEAFLSSDFFRPQAMLLQVIVLATLFTSAIADNWAVLVNTSKFWYDYRHTSNLLTMYQTLRRLGYEDSKILVMNAAQTGCDARNLFPGRHYASPDRDHNLYNGLEVDYRGPEVTPTQVFNVLVNRMADGTPENKRLLSGPNSHVLLYFTGHGGDGFLKFQDSEMLTAGQLAAAVDEMHIKRRFCSMLVIADSCQAATLGTKITAPNVTLLSSSQRHQSSYSLFNDSDLGVSIVDQFTYAMGKLLDHPGTSSMKMSQLAAQLAEGVELSTPVLRPGAVDISVASMFGGKTNGVVLDTDYMTYNILD